MLTSFRIDQKVIRFPITQPVLVLVGPTAVGKTDLSLGIARRFNCEIISMDSMQVYRYMDIGTAKITPEERQKIPHHLIDIVDPDQEYNAEIFVRDACRIIYETIEKGKIPLLTGGTGLYLRSLIEGLFDEGKKYPELRDQLKKRLATEGSSILHKELTLYDGISANLIHINDSHRLIRALEIYYGSGIPWSEHIRRQKEAKTASCFTNMLQLGLTCQRKILYENINKRCRVMIDKGLEKEVRGLLDAGFSSDLKPMMAIGYRHMINYINNMYDINKMEQVLATDTRHYAKRQFTWFNKNKDILWFDIAEQENIFTKITDWLNLH
jgi:tRNA dimethylallyltransferase